MTVLLVYRFPSGIKGWFCRECGDKRAADEAKAQLESGDEEQRTDD